MKKEWLFRQRIFTGKQVNNGLKATDSIKKIYLRKSLRTPAFFYKGGRTCLLLQKQKKN